MSSSVETHRFEAEVSQVLRLVINSLYSHKEIFLRELVSNASDALDKLKYKALTDHALSADATSLEIVITPDRDAGTLSIADTGIGMSKEELKRNLGTVAHSGSRAFIEALEKADVQLIGQFGVGFYSAYLVADSVEVTSRAAGTDEAWRWTSNAADSFTIEPAERDSFGTTVTLHLNEDQKEFLSDWKLKQLVTQYSDYISHPIKLLVEKYAEPAEEGGEPTTTQELEQVNRGVALWQRPKSELTDDDYSEFFKHLTHDWEPPLARAHFRVEGTQLFDSVLFVPKRPPFDLYARDQRHGMRLYVKRVFIMDDCEQLLPSFLRFVRGVVDSDDLPLNVSRELLQDSAVVRFIKKQVTKKALDMLDALAADSPEDYALFWEKYGAVIKEGLNTEPAQRDRITPLLRYRTSASEGEWVSLETYKSRMPEGQSAIYYVIGESDKAVAASPHLEALVSRGYEVLFMTDPIDEWALAGLTELDGTPLKSAMRADLGLDSSEDEAEGDDAKGEEGASHESLLGRIREVLGDRVGDVQLSKRLTKSPACLVVPEGGVHAHMERLLAASQPGFEGQKKIFEVNPKHSLIRALDKLQNADPDSARISEWIEVLYGQALLSEGSRIDDPARLANQITTLLEQAATAAADVSADSAKSSTSQPNTSV